LRGCEPVADDEWREAACAAMHLLPEQVRNATEERLLAAVLGEEQFGDDHWSLSWPKRAYYELKPFLPRQLAVGLRRKFHQLHHRRPFQLGWPVEDRFVRFRLGQVAALLRGRGLESAPFVHFWPDGHRFALVLTHDIEDAAGQAFVPAVAALEERLGFRSVFNFVAERYPVDCDLLDDLRARGFEIGVHGLKHDGKLFSSRRRFEARAQRINEHLRSWDAVGFRAPLTHRNPG